MLKNAGYHLTGDFMGDFGPGTLLVNGSNVPHAFHPYEAPEGDPESSAMFVIQFSVETLGPEFMAKLEKERIREFIASTHRSLEIRGRTRNVVESLIRQMVTRFEAQRLAQFILILDAMADAPEEDRVPLVSQIYAPSLKQKTAAGSIG